MCPILLGGGCICWEAPAAHSCTLQAERFPGSIQHQQLKEEPGPRQAVHRTSSSTGRCSAVQRTLQHPAMRASIQCKPDPAETVPTVVRRPPSHSDGTPGTKPDDCGSLCRCKSSLALLHRALACSRVGRLGWCRVLVDPSGLVPAEVAEPSMPIYQ